MLHWQVWLLVQLHNFPSVQYTYMITLNSTYQLPFSLTNKILTTTAQNNINYKTDTIIPKMIRDQFLPFQALQGLKRLSNATLPSIHILLLTVITKSPLFAISCTKASFELDFALSFVTESSLFDFWLTSLKRLEIAAWNIQIHKNTTQKKSSLQCH